MGITLSMGTALFFLGITKAAICVVLFSVVDSRINSKRTRMIKRISLTALVPLGILGLWHSWPFNTVASGFSTPFDLMFTLLIPAFWISTWNQNRKTLNKHIDDLIQALGNQMNHSDLMTVLQDTTQVELGLHYKLLVADFENQSAKLNSPESIAEWLVKKLGWGEDYRLLDIFRKTRKRLEAVSEPSE